MDGLGDAIFAFEMNDEPLPRDHGYPVRVILPGHAGCRQAKWVHKVILSDQESQKPWHQKSYRHFAPDMTFEKDMAAWPPERLDQAPIAQMMPIQSMICNPPQNTVIGGKNTNSITLKGVAWSGGGREVQRVDVSIDGGETWTAAELYKPIKQKWNHHWAWTQFYKTIELPEEIKQKLKRGENVRLDLVSKALNSDFNVQVGKMIDLVAISFDEIFLTNLHVLCLHDRSLKKNVCSLKQWNPTGMAVAWPSIIGTM
mmetsp:Transcript_26349/g.62706  ORF Transcript_26349/g.62706 Transcript_26349/m.62706 type:complete len:256 (-) Transcript_26349:604-1371(-)